MSEFPDNVQPALVLELCLDGVVTSREFDPYEEAIDVVGEALRLKAEHGVLHTVTILVSQASFIPHTEAERRHFLDKLDRARSLETCPVCGQPDNCGDCNHYGTPHYQP